MNIGGTVKKIALQRYRKHFLKLVNKIKTVFMYILHKVDKRSKFISQNLLTNSKRWGIFILTIVMV